MRTPSGAAPSPSHAPAPSDASPSADGGCDPVANPAADHDDDDSAATADDDEPKPRASEELLKKTVAQLKETLKTLGLKVGGNKSEIINRILNFQLTGLAAKEARAGTGSSKKKTKAEENRRLFAAALEAALDKAEDSATEDAALNAPRCAKAPTLVEAQYRRVLLYAEQLNASFVRMSRERAGPRSRFTGQDVIATGTTTAAELKPEHLALRGRLFEDDGSVWRIVHLDEGFSDDQHNALDGVFYDEHAAPPGVFVMYYLDGTLDPQPGIDDDFKKERYESLVATFRLLPIDDRDDSATGEEANQSKSPRK